MTINSIKTLFAVGEISPALYGRPDLVKYAGGCSTLRNCFVNYRGGANSRAGTAYVGKCKQSADAAPPRDIPFQFNLNQGYVLEFGDQYMRVKSQGAYVVETGKTITGATNTNPVALEITGHGYSVDDEVYITGMEGMTELNGLTWKVYSVPDANHITLYTLFDNPVDATDFGVYTTGGTAARIYTVVAPYAAIDLPFLKYTQSADTMSLTCVNQSTGTEYPPYELTRFGNTNWVFSQATFDPVITPPTNLIATAQSSTTLSTYYAYVVTAIDKDTGEESIASDFVSVQNNDISINAGSNTISWSPVANARSYNVYKATPSYNVTVPIGSLTGYIGTTTNTTFTDTNITIDYTSTPPTHEDPFASGAIDDVTVTFGGANLNQNTIGYTINTSTGSGFSAIPLITGDTLSSFLITHPGKNYVNTDTITIGIKASGTYTFVANPTAGQTIILNGVTWTFVSGTPTGNQTKIHSTVQNTVRALAQDLNASATAGIAVASYSLSGLVLNIYYDAIGTGGNAYTLAAGTYGGTVSGGTLTGGATDSATATLVVGATSGIYPGVVAYYQQRRVYANTLNKPDTYFFSRPGAYSNFDSSNPVTADSAFNGKPWAQQINGIQFMVPMTNGLITLSGNGAWLLNGGNQATITASSQTALAQSYNGCSFTLPPLVVNYEILYVQSKGSIVRDLSYNFYTNIFTGTDLTILSDHLFNYHQLRQWCYAEEPFKIIWAVRDDGTLLSLTFLKEQDIYGWARHDTNGLYVGVCSVTEPPVDAVYTIVKRYIKGEDAWAYYSERMDNRNWENAEDCFCVDAGLTTTSTFPNAVLTPAAAEGTNNISAVNLIAGGSGYTAPVVSVNDPLGVGSGATFSVTVSGGVITAISVLTEGINYTKGSTLTIADSTGTGAVAQPIITDNVVFNTNLPVFSAGNVGDVIRVNNNNSSTTTADTAITATGGGKAIITSYISPTSVIADIVEPITNILLDDDELPVPVSAGQWSISTPTTTVSGLNHLEGMTVAILADGSVVPNQTVVNGSIDLQQEYSVITVGLPFTAQVQTMYLDVPDPGGGNTVQGKRKNIQAVTARVEKSRGFSYGTNQPDQSTQPNNATVPWTDMKEAKERNALINAGASIPLFTGDVRVLVPGGWNKKGQIAIQQSYPLPLNLTAIIPEYTIGDTSG